MAVVAIQLDRLVGAEIHQREVNGEMCDCISIPIKWNGITCYRGTHYYIDFNMTRKRPNPNGHTHYLSLLYPPSMMEWYDKVKNLGLTKGLSYVGVVYGGDKSYEKTPKYKSTNTIEGIKRALNKE